MASPSALFALVVAVAAKKGDPAPPESENNAVVDYVMGLVDPVLAVSIAAAKDVFELVSGVPKFLVDVFVWAVGLARGVPALVVNVYNGDSATLDSLTAFAVYSAGVIFCVYVSLTALNLILSLAATVKDYIADYMVLPSKIAGQKLPVPVLNIFGIIQKNLIDPVRNFKVPAWIVPLEGQTGQPSLKGATAALATAISVSMILSCAPAVHGLMKSGANKASAEALAYTMGTALGLQYLVKLTA